MNYVKNFKQQSPITTGKTKTITTTTSIILALKASSSFHTYTECPLTAMLLFQLYPKYLKSNIPSLILLMMKALALCPPPWTSILSSCDYKRRNRKSSYVIATASFTILWIFIMLNKSLPFLMYLLPGFNKQMKPYEDYTATNVISFNYLF